MDALLGILLVTLIGGAFWQQRRQSEIAATQISRRLKQLELQLVSVSRGHWKLQRSNGRLRFVTCYHFEFSADGLDLYQGEAVMAGFSLVGFNLPPHRMPQQF
ncbi:DUF3301 domain-containing protein [Parasalinivibrio latis]|uniref:DUF3301 domain-containing protein n=1 Tax=Parasalinivibrio latis TaxID=2952610 RepID=UPI0030E0CAE1